jgi:hypothetical protein
MSPLFLLVTARLVARVLMLPALRFYSARGGQAWAVPARASGGSCADPEPQPLSDSFVLRCRLRRVCNLACSVVDVLIEAAHERGMSARHQ